MVDKGDVTDSYVDVHLGKARLVRTSVIDNDLNPKFNEEFRYISKASFLQNQILLNFFFSESKSVISPMN